MLLENAASCEALKDCLAGIWSYGSEPEAAKLLRFRAVMTGGFIAYVNGNCLKDNVLFSKTTS
jgi:hypothetical protein